MTLANLFGLLGFLILNFVYLYAVITEACHFWILIKRINFKFQDFFHLENCNKNSQKFLYSFQCNKAENMKYKILKHQKHKMLLTLKTLLNLKFWFFDLQKHDSEILEILKWKYITTKILKLILYFTLCFN